MSPIPVGTQAVVMGFEPSSLNRTYDSRVFFSPDVSSVNSSQDILESVRTVIIRTTLQDGHKRRIQNYAAQAKPKPVQVVEAFVPSEVVKRLDAIIITGNGTSDQALPTLVIIGGKVPAHERSLAEARARLANKSVVFLDADRRYKPNELPRATEQIAATSPDLEHYRQVFSLADGISVQGFSSLLDVQDMLKRFLNLPTDAQDPAETTPAPIPVPESPTVAEEHRGPINDLDTPERAAKAAMVTSLTAFVAIYDDEKRFLSATDAGEMILPLARNSQWPNTTRNSVNTTIAAVRRKSRSAVAVSPVEVPVEVIVATPACEPTPPQTVVSSEESELTTLKAENESLKAEINSIRNADVRALLEEVSVLRVRLANLESSGKKAHKLQQRMAQIAVLSRDEN